MISKWHEDLSASPCESTLTEAICRVEMNSMRFPISWRTAPLTLKLPECVEIRNIFVEIFVEFVFRTILFVKFNRELFSTLCAFASPRRVPSQFLERFLWAKYLNKIIWLLCCVIPKLFSVLCVFRFTSSFVTLFEYKRKLTFFITLPFFHSLHFHFFDASSIERSFQKFVDKSLRSLIIQYTFLVTLSSLSLSLWRNTSHPVRW